MEPKSGVEAGYSGMMSELVSGCTAAVAAGASPGDVRRGLLQETIDHVLNQINAADFVAWIRDDAGYSFYFYDAQQSTVCAKHREVAALIMENVVSDAIGAE
jgi:hypothetical protein